MATPAVATTETKTGPIPTTDLDVASTDDNNDEMYTTQKERDSPAKEQQYNPDCKDASWHCRPEPTLNFELKQGSQTADLE